MHDPLTTSAMTNVGAGISTAMFAMTDATNLAIVAAGANVFISIATLYFAYKAKVIGTEAKAISTEAKEAVNGKMEEFKRMAEDIFHAKGVADEKVAAESKAGIAAIAKAEGKAEGKAEVKDAPKNGK